MTDLFTIERINKRVSMELLLKKLKIELPRSRFLMCPAHKDKHPSLMIWGKEGQKLGWMCFQCGKKGHAVEFLALWKDISIPKAAGYLVKLLGRRKLEIDRNPQKAFNASVYHGWEDVVCSHVHKAIQSCPGSLRAMLYGGWLSFCEPFLDSVRWEFLVRNGDAALLENAKTEISNFLVFLTDLWETEGRKYDAQGTT